MRYAACIILAATWIWPHPAQTQEVISGRASVIDGDTLDIHGKRIRLIGIDAPESRQTCTAKDTGATIRCGQIAAFHLADMIGAASLRCETSGRDKYRRTLARCSLRGQDIGGMMVRGGWALPYLRDGKAYATDKAFAKARKNGLWNTSFQEPWVWRAQMKEKQRND